MIDDDTAREQIVTAADRLFYGRGVQAVGMDAVRAAAGVSLKRIYALFPSKDDLVVAVLQHRTQRWNAGILAATAAVGDPRDKLLAVFDFLAGWFVEEDFRGCAFINSFGELGALSPRVATTVRDQKSSFQDYVAALVHDAGAPANLAPQLAILAEGAQTTAAIAGRPDAAHQARDAAATLIEVALRPAPTPA
ncbi:TetR/AcrR family transcriptional regulator [Cellulomonas citrea]|uniref:TetR/AcrR family transcriptional regulator n=1 Tax=Cellulomonas citrea TaxID=1909423 RepID=UPI00135926B5|nr:TetR/AcrR family transcriptional regulator [Cellulomonas citrea]